MRKWIITVVLLGLLLSLAVPGFAAGIGAGITDAVGMPGDTVYITVSLTGAVTGDTMGIAYTFDEKQLEVLPDLCSWSKSGVLKDFSKTSYEAVWTSGKTMDLQGDICVLAFRILENGNFREAAVSCKVIVKNGAQEVGCFETSGRITGTCSHSYGDWVSEGMLGHGRSCSLCGGTQYASHEWKETSRVQDPLNIGYVTVTDTCESCGETREEKIQTDDYEILPTHPVATEPTAPEPTVIRPPETEPERTIPTEPRETEPEFFREPEKKPDPTQKPEPDQPEKQPEEQTHPTVEQPRDFNEVTEPTQPDHPDRETPREHDHIHEVIDGEEVVIVEAEDGHPMIIPVKQGSSEEEIQQAVEQALEEHDHAHEPEAAADPKSIFALVATLALMGGGLLFFLKKKKRR